jgi:hypothetical protein
MMKEIVQLLEEIEKAERMVKLFRRGDCTNTRKATREYRLSQWTQIIQAKVDSGKTVKDFCQGKGISKDAYYYWQHELREMAAENLEKAEGLREMVPNGWMQLIPSRPNSTPAMIDIEINRCLVKVSTETEPELLKKVCLTLLSL